LVDQPSSNLKIAVLRGAPVDYRGVSKMGIIQRRGGFASTFTRSTRGKDAGFNGRVSSPIAVAPIGVSLRRLDRGRLRRRGLRIWLKAASG
jgi:hypothetical protein